MKDIFLKVALIATTIFVLAICVTAIYMLNHVTTPGMVVLWGIILAANIGNCWMLGKAFAFAFN